MALTTGARLDILPFNAEGFDGLYPVYGSLSAATPATVIAVDAGKIGGIVAVFFGETDATNLTFTSGATSVVIPEFPASTVMNNPIQRDTILFTSLAAGDDIIVEASVDISSILFYACQFDKVRFC